LKGYLQVGKIINTHGVKGEVKIMPLTDNRERFDLLKTVINVTKDSVTEKDVLDSKKLTIENVKYQNEKIIIKFQEINNVEEAISLKESFLVISREDAVKLPENTYFICDLIGCEVTDTKRGFLGNITNIIETGSNDVYIVRNNKREETLVPALKTVVKSVNIEDKKIVVEMPEGL
jgi:16S rRNA processing protein RimM